ncbi:MAG: MFS transporter, partial [Alphaproteobacteria bacterium]
AAFMAVGMATVWFTGEPPRAAPPETAAAAGDRAALRIAAWIASAVIGPFREFMQRPGWLAILVFVVLYKFGDALSGTMANPFYVAMGFTRIEVANISKVFGVVATLAGVAAGGVLVHRQGLARALVACGVLQALSNLMYALQAMVGHDVLMLAATIGIENFTGGMGSAAFVAYLSGLCNVAYTATQYALLSSLAAVGRTTLSAGGGWLSLQLDWVLFFAATTLAALPGIAMAIWVMRRFPPRREGDA